ncbi:hypothetical protein D3C72_2345030 [compost metagenome]
MDNDFVVTISRRKSPLISHAFTPVALSSIIIFISFAVAKLLPLASLKELELVNEN